MNPYIPIEYKIIDFVRETHDNFTMTVNMKVDHQPGQFVQISIPGIGEAPISICSDSKKFIKLNVREVGNVTKALGRLKKGDNILIRGPYGRGYPMDQFKGKDLIVVGGGCGVAPLRGIIDYINNHRKDYKDIYLYLGYRSPKDILFKYDINDWEKNFNFFMSVDTKAEGEHCYDANAGYVTDTLKASELKPDNKIVFICGPPIMMNFAVKILKDQGFTDDQIYVGAERLMYCAVGVCCHCMIRGKFTCRDGPVFRYDEIDFKND